MQSVGEDDRAAAVDQGAVVDVPADAAREGGALAVAAQLTPGTAVHFTVAGSSLTPRVVRTPTSLELP